MERGGGGGGAAGGGSLLSAQNICTHKSEIGAALAFV